MLMFYFQNPKTTPNDAKQAVAARGLSTAPVMVICGSPWDTSLVYLVVDGTVLLEVNELCQAWSILFALFYILNYQYPKADGGIICTMTFVQKCIFGIRDKVKVPGRVETLSKHIM